MTDELKENQGEKETTSLETSKKVSLAEIQQSELFRKTQSEKDRAIAQAKTLESQLSSLQDKLDNLELKQHEALIGETGDPNVAKQILNELRIVKQQIKDKDKELAKQEAIIEELRPAAKLRDAQTLATQYECPIEVLMEAETLAEMTGMAKAYSRLKESKPKESESPLPKHVDSGQATVNAGGRIWKESEIQKMTPDERLKNASDINKAVKEGRIRKDS